MEGQGLMFLQFWLQKVIAHEKYDVWLFEYFEIPVTMQLQF